MVNKFNFINKKYKLKRLINMPDDDHYRNIIEFEIESFCMNKGLLYYYNDNRNNNEIIPLDNLREILSKEIPILPLYEKENSI